MIKTFKIITCIAMVLIILYSVLLAMGNAVLLDIIGICVISAISLSFLCIIVCFLILLFSAMVATVKAGKGIEFLLKILFEKIQKPLDK